MNTAYHEGMKKQILVSFFKDLSDKIQTNKLSDKKLFECSKFYFDYYSDFKKSDPENYVGLAMYLSHVLNTD